VDNHVHLDHARQGEERADVATALAQAAAVGVDRLVQIGCDLGGARFTVDEVERHTGLLGGVSLHPNEVPRLVARGELDSALAEIERLAQHPRVRVVGETGLDYYRTGPDGRPAQQQAFRWHIDLAKRTGKVLQIHDREAHDDVLRILAEERVQEVGGIMHCFSGDAAIARRCLDLGFLISLAGPVTYPSAGALAEVARLVPADRLVIETDCPFLPPQGHRGKGRRNEPALLAVTAARVAALRGEPLPALAERMTANACALLGVP
jgi:TatD DNase family protein